MRTHPARVRTTVKVEKRCCISSGMDRSAAIADVPASASANGSRKSASGSDVSPARTAAVVRALPATSLCVTLVPER